VARLKVIYLEDGTGNVGDLIDTVSISARYFKTRYEVSEVCLRLYAANGTYVVDFGCRDVSNLSVGQSIDINAVSRYITNFVRDVGALDVKRATSGTDIEVPVDGDVLVVMITTDFGKEYSVKLNGSEIYRDVIDDYDDDGRGVEAIAIYGVGAGSTIRVDYGGSMDVYVFVFKSLPQDIFSLYIMEKPVDSTYRSVDIYIASLAIRIPYFTTYNEYKIRELSIGM
jgi:hypothetical protein